MVYYMRKMIIHKILENPGVHNAVQKMLSIGRRRTLRYTEECIRKYCSGKVLDIGCGTGRYAHLFKDNYMGIDINSKYLKADKYACADAARLPFKDEVFDSIFSVGFFHHVDKYASRNVFNEIIRVTKPEAAVLFIDAFYPDNPFDILGRWLMKIDRGRFPRKKDEFKKELDDYFDIDVRFDILHSYPYHLGCFVGRKKNNNA